MYHNGGFPPIYEGGKKEVVQREFSAENILSISQIFNNQLSSNSSKISSKLKSAKSTSIDILPITKII